MRGLKVLLPRADIGREILADELRKHGAEVTAHDLPLHCPRPGAPLAAYGGVRLGF